MLLFYGITILFIIINILITYFVLLFLKELNGFNFFFGDPHDRPDPSWHEAHENDADRPAASLRRASAQPGRVVAVHATDALKSPHRPLNDDSTMPASPLTRAPLRAATPMPSGEVQSFVLPWPVSVNALYRTVGGRPCLNRGARAWKAQALALLGSSRCLGVPWPLPGRLAVVIEAFPPNRHKRDLDNLLKVILDAANGVLWGDDQQIDDLRIVRSQLDPKKYGFVRLIVSVLA